MIGGAIPKDFVVWYKNPNADEQDLDNSNRPLYLVRKSHLTYIVPRSKTGK